MQIEHICLNCMTDKAGQTVCPACGIDDTQLTEEAHALPLRTMLQGKYLIGRLLGSGGFGNTYLALDTTLLQKIAIKEYLPRDFSTRAPRDPNVSIFSGEKTEYYRLGMERFLAEAQTLAKFNNHPGIVSVSDFFHANQTAYIVMEYVEGLTLKQYVQQKGGTIPLYEALQILTPVMDALREVHSVGMLHRDVSPDNIFITRDKRVKLLDFGAARQMLGDVSKSLSVILKPGYAPAEQYSSRGKQGAWTDVYAVAATMYAVVVGHPPDDAMARMVEDTLQPIGVTVPGVPDHVDRAIAQALAVRVEHRWQTIASFQQALATADSSVANVPTTEPISLLNEQSAHSAPSGPSPSPTVNATPTPPTDVKQAAPETDKPKKINPLVPVIFVVIVVGLIIFLVIALSGKKEPEPETGTELTPTPPTEQLSSPENTESAGAKDKLLSASYEETDATAETGRLDVTYQKNGQQQTVTFTTINDRIPFSNTTTEDIDGDGITEIINQRAIQLPDNIRATQADKPKWTSVYRFDPATESFVDISIYNQAYYSDVLLPRLKEKNNTNDSFITQHLIDAVEAYVAGELAASDADLTRFFADLVPKAASEDEVIDHLYNSVPEIREFESYLSKNNSKLVMSIESTPSEEESYYGVYVGESQPERNVRWNTFHVEKSLDHILVDDVISGERVTLEQWRTQQ